MTLKIYAYDRGWRGASLIVTDSFEKARKHLLDYEIAHWKKCDEEHQKAEANGRPPQHNPFADRWKIMEAHPEKYIDVYDIVDGLEIEFDGDC